MLDKQTLIRKAIKSIITSRNLGFIPVEASSYESARQWHPATPIDIIIADYDSLGPRTLDTLQYFRTMYPASKLILVLSTLDIPEGIYAPETGVYALIQKTSDIEELFEAIEAASAGKIYRNNCYTEILYRKMDAHLTGTQLFEERPLNDVQKKVLQLLWEEKNTHEIATNIYASVSTVEKIKQMMKEKIGVRSTIGLIKYGVQQRLLG